MDEKVRYHFDGLLAQARQNKLNHWLEDRDGKLALVILMDQFNRSLNRKKAAAFELDDKAFLIAKSIVESGDLLKEYRTYEACWLLVPFQHRENVEDNQVNVEYAHELLDATKETGAASQAHLDYLKFFLDMAYLHKKIVKQFGRYPHRNEALGRLSTPEEIEYLENGANRFGQ